MGMFVSHTFEICMQLTTGIEPEYINGQNGTTPFHLPVFVSDPIDIGTATDNVVSGARKLAMQKDTIHPK